jgi:hypothetical protein
MQIDFTEEYLILYIYNELSAPEREIVAKAIETNTVIREQYRAMLETTAMLNFAISEPNATTIEMIMEHAHYEELPH